MPFMFNRNDRPNARKKGSQASRKSSRNKVSWQWNPNYLPLIVALFAVLLIITLLPNDEIMPIEKIRLSGQFKQLDTANIEQQLKPFLSVSFFAVDIQRIQLDLQQRPWIEQVSVRRVWPDELSVSITEKQAFARWDNTQLLSNKGKIFKADTKSFSHLPVVNGYAGQSRQLLQRFHSLRQRFNRHGITLSELYEDSKGALNLVLDDQLKVSLGSKNSNEKIDHMLAVYQQQIKNRTQHIRHIDFRYSNGFAIAWKEQYLKQQTERLKRGSKNV